jgi:hypothetical protein
MVPSCPFSAAARSKAPANEIAGYEEQHVCQQQESAALPFGVSRATTWLNLMMIPRRVVES